MKLRSMELMMMLETLYKKGYLDCTKIILDNAKALGLNAEESFVLIRILENYKVTKTLSLEHLQENVLITSNKIDKIVADLMERGYYEIFIAYDKGVGKECISFKPLFEKIIKVVNNEVSVDNYDLEKAARFLSSNLNRVLTSSELEILESFMTDDHYSLKDIEDATKRITDKKRVLSMRTLTQELTNKDKVSNVKQEAPKALKDFFDKI